jgi:hypothetical protein
VLCEVEVSFLFKILFENVRPFLATYFIFEKEAKHSKKVRL